LLNSDTSESEKIIDMNKGNQKYLSIEIAIIDIMYALKRNIGSIPI
jgi:hypothetical protein